MSLFFILLIPVLLALAGLIFSKGRINPAEFGVSLAVVLLIVFVPYGIALYGRTADTEIWNGVVAHKEMTDVSCCHPYCCQYCTTCTTDSKGNQSCSTSCCMTCYEHSFDHSWDAYSSNDEHIFHDGCNAPYRPEPRRWTEIVLGEPTAVEHAYTNYIKGNPDTLMRRTGAAEIYSARIPRYPGVYDFYRAQRFLTDGVRLPDLLGLNQKLDGVNARLGARKKVNIVVIVTSVTDEKYLEAVRETWIGGKINDTVVLVGVEAATLEVRWAGVISWTKSEQVKVDLRNRILDQKVLDPDRMLAAIEEEVSAKFEHRRIQEFEYLNASITPSDGLKWFLGILAAIVSGALQVFFWVNDPFEQYTLNRNRRLNLR